MPFEINTLPQSKLCHKTLLPFSFAKQLTSSYVHSFIRSYHSSVRRSDKCASILYFGIAFNFYATQSVPMITSLGGLSFAFLIINCEFSILKTNLLSKKYIEEATSGEVRVGNSQKS